MEKLIKSYTIAPPSAKTELKAVSEVRKTPTFSGREDVFFRKHRAPIYSGGAVIMQVEGDTKKTETITQRVLRLKNEPIGVIYDDDTQMMEALHK
jgi:hypothetical protein